VWWLFAWIIAVNGFCIQSYGQAATYVRKVDTAFSFVTTSITADRAIFQVDIPYDGMIEVWILDGERNPVQRDQFICKSGSSTLAFNFGQPLINAGNYYCRLRYKGRAREVPVIFP
jgi:hypothetical protein